MRGYSHETTIVRFNYFYTTNKMGAWGIDMDDGSCNYHVYNNLCVGVCIKLRDGDYRIVENNIIFYPLVPEDISVGYDKNHDKVRRNILVTDQETYRVIWPPHHHPWFELDYNLFFNPKGDFVADVLPRHGTRRSYTFDEWKALGYDVHSLCADPLFVDAAKGDFRLKPESPALKLGFKPFDTSTIGLLPGFSNPWRP